MHFSLRIPRISCVFRGNKDERKQKERAEGGEEEEEEEEEEREEEGHAPSPRTARHPPDTLGC